MADGVWDSQTYKQVQLDHFYESLLDSGMMPSDARPTNWREAFRMPRISSVARIAKSQNKIAQKTKTK